MFTTRAVSKSSAAHSPYQRLFMLPGAKAFCLSGAVARLPISMMSLGIVLALNHLYDNWTIAGTMSAAYVLAMSCVTPFYARAFDRFGQPAAGFLPTEEELVSALRPVVGWTPSPDLPLFQDTTFEPIYQDTEEPGLLRWRWTR